MLEQILYKKTDAEYKVQRPLCVGCSRSSSQGSRSWSRLTDSAGSFIGLFSTCLVFSLFNFRFSLGIFFHSLVCLTYWKMWYIRITIGVPSEEDKDCHYEEWNVFPNKIVNVCIIQPHLSIVIPWIFKIGDINCCDECAKDLCIWQKDECCQDRNWVVAKQLCKPLWIMADENRECY